MKSKYLFFEQLKSKPKTEVHRVHNAKHGETLGDIKWYAPWRQYCFIIDDMVFSRGCMRDICDFIDQLMKKRKR